MATIHNYLIVSALGINRPHVVSELSRSCVQCGCNLLQARINTLGQEIAITLFISGNWGAIAKMEATLPILEQRLGLSIQARRTHEPTPIESTVKLITYSIQVTAIDKIGILNGLSEFLNQHSIPIEEISAHTYLTHTNTRMVSLHLKINVPDKVHLATLRDQLMTYCDEHNLDAFLDPLRHS